MSKRVNSNHGNRIALVTGASGAIGGAIARQLAAAGASVAVHYGRDRMGADRAVAAIEAAGGTAVAFGGDLTDSATVVRLFDQVHERFGRLDTVVANAGVGSALVSVTDSAEESFDRAMLVNAKGTFLVLREAGRRVADGGHIVAISSSTVDNPEEGMAVYAGSKAIVRTWVRVLAQELGSRGVTVNAVSPGPTIPGVFEFASDAVRSKAAASSPFGRLGAPEDTASIVSFLCSKSARWITGQHILSNGGARV